MEGIKAWLSQEPEKEDISTNPDGSQYIPIAIVETLLDVLTGGDWSTRNFQLTIQPIIASGSLQSYLVSAYITLSVSYAVGDDIVIRDLVGAITFNSSDYGGNMDFAATALSEATKNAAKKLGPRFGKNLNGRNDRKVMPELRKPKMDAVTLQKYKLAHQKCDTKTVSEIESIFDTSGYQ